MLAPRHIDICLYEASISLAIVIYSMSLDIGRIISEIISPFTWQIFRCGVWLYVDMSLRCLKIGWVWIPTRLVGCLGDNHQEFTVTTTEQLRSVSGAQSSSHIDICAYSESVPPVSIYAYTQLRSICGSGGHMYICRYGVRPRYIRISTDT